MPLTSAQRTTLRTDIQADGTLNTLPHTSASAQALADAYNAVASPDFWVWKSVLPPSEYTGSAGVVWAEIDALTVGKARIFEWMTGNLTRALNPSDPNQRQGAQDAFAAGTTTRTNLIAMFRRRATRLEKLFANTSQGAGTTAAPATLVVEGNLTTSEADQTWSN